MRLLAKKLSAAGFDTLRFDYYGTGDSGGETTAAELSGWKDDIVAAAHELKEMSDTQRVVLVGVRLGGTLVAEVAPRLGENIDGIVLWDPIVHGASYLRGMRNERGYDDSVSEPSAFKEKGASAVLEMEGVPVSQAFVSDLQAIDLCSKELRLPARRLIVFTDRPATPCKLLDDNLASEADILMMNAALPWSVAPAGEEAFPIEICDRIIEWLR